jgi:hypothetical protein
MLEIDIEKLPSFIMGRNRAREEIKNKLLNIAKELLIMNVPLEKIIEITELDKSDLENLN